jgi:hypothetical protein
MTILIYLVGGVQRNVQPVARIALEVLFFFPSLNVLAGLC